MDIILPESSSNSHFLLFSLGDKIYGVNIIYVRNILPWQESEAITTHPKYVRGTLSIDNMLVPICDFKYMIKGELTQIDTRQTALIILAGFHNKIALMVDKAWEVISVKTETKLNPSSLDKNSLINTVISYNNLTIHIIDSEALLNQEMFEPT